MLVLSRKSNESIIIHDDIVVTVLGIRGDRVRLGIEAPRLVLSRKSNESIVIHDDIVVTVLDIRGDRVRLGIEAPRDVPVNRREVFDAIRRDGRIGTVAPV